MMKALSLLKRKSIFIKKKVWPHVRQKRGSSLLELALVMGIVGVMAMGIAPLMHHMRETQKNARLHTLRDDVLRSLADYAITHGALPPPRGTYDGQKGYVTGKIPFEALGWYSPPQDRDAFFYTVHQAFLPKPFLPNQETVTQDPVTRFCMQETDSGYLVEISQQKKTKPMHRILLSRDHLLSRYGHFSCAALRYRLKSREKEHRDHKADRQNIGASEKTSEKVQPSTPFEW